MFKQIIFAPVAGRGRFLPYQAMLWLVGAQLILLHASWHGQ